MDLGRERGKPAQPEHRRPGRDGGRDGSGLGTRRTEHIMIVLRAELLRDLSDRKTGKVASETKVTNDKGGEGSLCEKTVAPLVCDGSHSPRGYSDLTSLVRGCEFPNGLLWCGAEEGDNHESSMFAKR